MSSTLSEEREDEKSMRRSMREQSARIEAYSVHTGTAALRDSIGNCRESA